MLPDGTNPEGVDPNPKVGWHKTSLQDIVLVSAPFSPPCTKIRCHLSYSNMNYRIKAPAEYRKGKTPDKSYMAIPVIWVQGRQVNDSYVIVKSLVPPMYGEEWTSVYDEWEKKITYGLQIAMEVESAEDPKSWGTILDGSGYPAFLASLFGCCLPFPKFAASIRAERAEKDEAYGPLRTMAEYCSEFRAALGGKRYFNGEAICPVDISFFGTVQAWANVPRVQRALRDSDLNTWFTRVAKRMPSSVVGSKDR